MIVSMKGEEMRTKEFSSSHRIALRSLTTSILLAVLLLTSASARGTENAAQTSKSPRNPVYKINAGRTLRVRIDGELDSERARKGDIFTATVVDPVYSGGGVLVIPQASTVTGKVTSVTRAGKGGEPASIDVSFTSLRLPNGMRRSIDGSLTDLSGKRGESDAEGGVSAQKGSNRNTKFIGGGAGGGALIGAIAGGGKGLLIGGAIGAATGAVAKEVKKGHEVKVKSGTEFGVILNYGMALPKYRASTNR